MAVKYPILLYKVKMQYVHIWHFFTCIYEQPKGAYVY